MASYDLIVAGTGFASTFFLLRWLETASPSARVLVLERGQDDSPAWQRANRTNSSQPGPLFAETAQTYPWTMTVGFGGGSNCWFGNTPRLLPADFELKSRYGVGTDWPLSYAELEPDLSKRSKPFQAIGKTMSTIAALAKIDSKAFLRFAP